MRYVYNPGFQFWPDQMEPTGRVGTELLFYVPSALSICDQRITKLGKS